MFSFGEIFGGDNAAPNIMTPNESTAKGGYISTGTKEVGTIYKTDGSNSPLILAAVVLGAIWLIKKYKK